MSDAVKSYCSKLNSWSFLFVFVLVMPSIQRSQCSKIVANNQQVGFIFMISDNSGDDECYFVPQISAVFKTKTKNISQGVSPVRTQPIRTCGLLYPNNKGTEQSAHPRSLISGFVIFSLQRMISKLAS